MGPRLTFSELLRIKRWHVHNRREHPVENQMLDMVLMLWIMGWVGWLPAYAFDVPWAFPLCAVAMVLPQLYVRWREREHFAERLRCDWVTPRL